MKNQNNIDKLFKEAFDKFEVDPGEGMWTKVQSGISTTASSAVSAASSSTFSWVASAIVAVTITGAAIGGYFYFNEKGETKKNTSIKKNEAAIEIVQQKINTEAILEKDGSGNLNTKEKIKTESPTKETSIENKLLSKNSNAAIPASKNQSDVQEKSDAKENPNQLDKISASDRNETDKQVDDNVTEKELSSNSSQSTESINTKPNASVSEVHSEEKTTSVDSKTKESINEAGEPISTNESKEKVTVHIVFPNVFTPNQDGRTDKFEVIKELCKGLDQIENAKMIIQNKTGKVVYQWSGVNGSWDGTLPNGTLAPEGNYIFQFSYSVNGKPQSPKSGLFTLLP